MTTYQNTISDILHGDRSEEQLPRCFMKIGKKIYIEEGRGIHYQIEMSSMTIIWQNKK